MSKRFVLHEDRSWDAMAIYIEDTKHNIYGHAFLCKDEIVDELNDLYYQVCQLKGLVEQRNKQIKNLKTNNKHSAEKKNHKIAVLERAFKKACKQLSEAFGECPYANMELKRPDYCEKECEKHEELLCWDVYLLDQAEKELEEKK